MVRRSSVFLTLSVFAWAACDKLPFRPGAPAPSASGSASSSDEHETAHESSSALPAHAHASASGSSQARAQASAKAFFVPFAWEASREDPLAHTRGYVRQLLHDNTAFMQGHPQAFFKPMIDTQKPRVTLLTCSDSRVQTPAFDASPENDVFTIRNIGNQLVTAEGSVEYGVHHLKTPVLLVLGHTGCGAVRAAMGDPSKEHGPIRKELETMVVPRSKDGKVEASSWLEGVLVHTNHQVGAAVAKFESDVRQGNLTVIGAVYDLRNDMKMGFGKINIINVNGQTDPVKVTGFVKAIESAPAPSSSSSPPAVDDDPEDSDEPRGHRPHAPIGPSQRH